MRKHLAQARVAANVVVLQRAVENAVEHLRMDEPALVHPDRLETSRYALDLAE
ncbi:hypothetical protein [Nocardia donostiensis]|uniref:hypothetical protein n=1 Tax=Nocardia donostiensis TaxID=1538463 RepID=UPI001FE971DC|nr:hypothetical protein [Nocardia donostiensis]